MTRLTLALTLLAALAAALLWQLVWHPASRLLSIGDPPAALTSSVQAPGAAPTLAAAAQAVTGTASATATELRNALDYRSALLHLRASLAADTPLLRSLHEEVRVACSNVLLPDPVQRRVEDDRNRRPWLDRLRVRCSGIQSSDLDTPLWTETGLAAWQAQLPATHLALAGDEAAATQARRLLRDSVDAGLLAEALRHALLRGQLPLAEIYAGLPIPPRSDLEAAILPAADWIACLRSAACGSEALWTLHTCAQHGCPPGSDLPAAYHRLLPRQQYENAAALVRWLAPGPH